MKVVDLKNGIAKEIQDVDITNINQADVDKIRDVLLKCPIVVIKNQENRSLPFAQLVHRLGKGNDGHHIHNWDKLYWYEDASWSEYYQPGTNMPAYPNPMSWKGESYPVQRVTGAKNDEGIFSGIFQDGRLDWHSNLNNVNHADGVALQGVASCEGTQTIWNNTVPALEEMPEDLYEKIRGRYCEYEYVFTKWAGMKSIHQMVWMMARHDFVATPGYDRNYRFWLEQTNIGGTKGIYFFPLNNARIEDDKGRKIYKELREYLYQDKYIYEHNWEPGDIVLSDQLITQHKRPKTKPNWEEVLQKRLLHRYTFFLSQPEIPKWNNFTNAPQRIK